MLTVISKVANRSYELARSRPKGWTSVLINQAAAMAKSPYVPRLPVNITIEPTTTCNLRCPICETGTGALGRPGGTMKTQVFRRILEQIGPSANTLMFYFMGEPFLNKASYEMLALAKQSGLWITTCTNGEFVDSEKLVDSGLDEINFQIAGLTEQTHAKYRDGASLSRTVANIRAVCEEKRTKGAGHPRIILGFIVMRHNEHELPELESFGRDMGVDEVSIINPCVRRVEQAEQMLPRDRRYWVYDPESLERGELRPLSVPEQGCYRIWHSIVVTWCGDVVPCCRDADGRFVMGNLLEEPLADIWNNERFRAFRKKILEDRASMPLCRTCTGYGVPNLF